MSQQVPVIVKLVTEAYHGRGGKVTHQPGQLFAAEAVLPEGVSWRWALASAEGILQHRDQFGRHAVHLTDEPA